MLGVHVPDISHSVTKGSGVPIGMEHSALKEFRLTQRTSKGFLEVHLWVEGKERHRLSHGGRCCVPATLVTLLWLVTPPFSFWAGRVLDLDLSIFLRCLLLPQAAHLRVLKPLPWALQLTASSRE